MEREKKYFLINTADYKGYRLGSADCDNGKILYNTVRVEENLIFDINISQMGELQRLLQCFNLEISALDGQYIRVKVNPRGEL
ncbi:hypothetical protein [Clostridium sp.]|uniref:hypothetical protein n=1 Tax=Clostridium sp. TaxID=1506 RepID=UPI001B4A87C8|nr:hypothetical protein [Clostridium sp.]MBP3914532.1 hypothetical protein [Clostridium sp.]